MIDGLDPVLGAVLALAGVVLGALGGGTPAYYLRRREERSQLRAAARLVGAELSRLHDAIATAQAVDDLEILVGHLPRQEWDLHRSLLARLLVDEVSWHALEAAYKATNVLETSLRYDVDGDTAERYARDADDAVREAAADLCGYAGIVNVMAAHTNDQSAALTGSKRTGSPRCDYAALQEHLSSH